MTLTDDLYHIAEHIGDDQPNLPVGAKNTLLLAAKRIAGLEASLAESQRLHDAGGSRELKLIARVKELEAENARTLQLVEAVEAADPLEHDQDDVWGMIVTLAAEIKAEQEQQQ